MLKVASPKNAINLVAGLVSLFFDRVIGPLPVEETIAEADDLTKINGIGPSFARRLREAGIHTYADLAALSPEQVVEITDVKEWQADPAQWIAQAKLLA